MRWSTVLFDLDDTLYPEAQYVRSGFAAVSLWAESQFGWPADQSLTELERLFAQGVRGRTFNLWLEGHAVDPAPWIAPAVAVYRGHAPTIALHDGAATVLTFLRPRVALGIVSDGPLLMQQRKVAALGLDRYVGCIVLSDAWGLAAWKPSPFPFEQALAQLGRTAAGAVYIGDNPAKDFLGARRAGMQSIRLRLPNGEHVSEVPANVDFAPDLEVSTWVGLQAHLDLPD